MHAHKPAVAAAKFTKLLAIFVSLQGETSLSQTAALLASSASARQASGGMIAQDDVTTVGLAAR